MAAEFEVHGWFHLPERSLFGVSGVFLSGMAQVGMEATLPEDDAAFGARVHSIEFVDPSNPDAEGSEPALLFSYSRPEKVEGWKAIRWPGAVLSLGWRSG